MGRMEREKGKAFERKIAALLRARWQSATVRRASQAERADNPDVFCTGGPPLLSRLWLELQDAKRPEPLAKLAQAEGDVAAHVRLRGNRGELAAERLPLVVWHRIHEQSVHVTTRLWVIGEVAGLSSKGRLHQVITMELEEFLDLVHRSES